MGHGLILECRKCGYKIQPHLGVGFLYPKIYQETMESALEGKFGEQLKSFLETHSDGVLNCDTVLLQCEECGFLDTNLDLSSYLPKEGMVTPKVDRWSVAFPFTGAVCVAPWDLEDYVLVSHYEHRCKKCGAATKTFSERDIEEKYGKFFFLQETDWACPECGKLLWNAGDIMWD